MNRRKSMFAAGLATTVSALALTLGGLAAPAQAAAGTVDCHGTVHNNNPNHGIVGCQNNTDHNVTFRAEIVCGLAPDVSGDWVTLTPGQYSESSGVCAFYSSGVGSVGWTIQ